MKPEPRPIRIGISACLLGQRVRYDGGHKYQPWTRSYGRRIEWVPVCPEVELGLGTPREPIQLIAGPRPPSPHTLRRPRAPSVVPAQPALASLRRGAGTQALDSRFRGNDRISPRLVGVVSGLDHTRRMRAYAAARLRELAALGLCGYVFKDRSPSCGLDGVPVLDQSGDATASGSGLFARALRARFPSLPVTGEGRLRDPARREEFLNRVLAYARRRSSAPRQKPAGAGR